MLTYWRVLRGFDRRLLSWLGAWALVGFSYFGVQSVLLNLYLLRLGFGLEFVGLLIGASQLVWAACALPAGAIGTRVGFGRALTVAHLLFAVCSGLLVAVEVLPRGAWGPCLFACWIVFWMGAALWTVNGSPFVMAIASPEERNFAFPYQQAVQSLAAVFGSLIAGVLPGLLAGWLGQPLSDAAPFRWALLLAVPAYVGGATLLSRVGHVRAAGEGVETGQSGSSTPVLLFALLGLSGFLWRSGEGSVRAFFNVYLDVGLAVEPAQIGTVMGTAQALPLLAALVVPRLFGRMGSAHTLALSCAGLAATLLLLAAVPAWQVAALGFMGAMTMVAFGGPAAGLFSQEIATPHWRTTTSAVNTIGMAVGWASAAAAGGYLVRWIGFGGVFLVGALLALVSVVGILGVSRLPSARSARLAASSAVRQA